MAREKVSMSQLFRADDTLQGCWGTLGVGVGFRKMSLASGRSQREEGWVGTLRGSCLRPLGRSKFVWATNTDYSLKIQSL